MTYSVMIQVTDERGEGWDMGGDIEFLTLEEARKAFPAHKSEYEANAGEDGWWYIWDHENRQVVETLE